MKRLTVRKLLGLSALFSASLVWSPCSAVAAASGDYLEQYDTIYNTLIVERHGTLVELRARSKRGEFLESAVDVAVPLELVVPYTRTLFAGLLIEPAPQRVLMIGLGGAAFHRLFAAAFPDSLLQSVEIDPKVAELAQTRLGFKPTENTPIATEDGRLFVKRSKEKWDWIILDAFRGGFVPPHLKTEEFYRECAAKLTDGGVFIVNLHSGTQLYNADLKTLSAVFPQLVVFASNRNRIACAVKFAAPRVTKAPAWNFSRALDARLLGKVELDRVRAELTEWRSPDVDKAKVLTDDFAPVEFLDAIQANNTEVH